MKRPTSLERQMKKIIKKYNLPYRYTGDGSFLIGFKNPDFVNINGEKKLIEVAFDFFKIKIYGSIENYIQQRKEHFAKYGWESYFFITKNNELNEEEILKTIR